MRVELQLVELRVVRFLVVDFGFAVVGCFAAVDFAVDLADDLVGDFALVLADDSAAVDVLFVRRRVGAAFVPGTSALPLPTTEPAAPATVLTASPATSTTPPATLPAVFPMLARMPFDFATISPPCHALSYARASQQDADHWQAPPACYVCLT
jgi:hypothetical protein